MVHRRETFHENLANSNKTAVARPHGALQLRSCIQNFTVLLVALSKKKKKKPHTGKKKKKEEDWSQTKVPVIMAAAPRCFVDGPLKASCENRFETDAQPPSFDTNAWTNARDLLYHSSKGRKKEHDYAHLYQISTNMNSISTIITKDIQPSLRFHGRLSNFLFIFLIRVFWVIETFRCWGKSLKS